MVKVNKVILSLVALATVRASGALEPSYPGDPIPPLAPQAPAEPFDFGALSSFASMASITDLAKNINTESLVSAVTSYVTGAPMESKVDPGYLDSIAAAIPGGKEALDSMKEKIESVSALVPDGLSSSALAIAGYFGY